MKKVFDNRILKNLRERQNGKDRKTAKRTLSVLIVLVMVVTPIIVFIETSPAELHAHAEYACDHIHTVDCFIAPEGHECSSKSEDADLTTGCTPIYPTKDETPDLTEETEDTGAQPIGWICQALTIPVCAHKDCEEGAPCILETAKESISPRNLPLGKHSLYRLLGPVENNEPEEPGPVGSGDSVESSPVESSDSEELDFIESNDAETPGSDEPFIFKTPGLGESGNPKAPDFGGLGGLNMPGLGEIDETGEPDSGDSGENEEPESEEEVEELSLMGAPDTGSISGFLWVDGNGMKPTDWNGLYDIGENPLAWFPVSLYSSSNMTTPIAQTQTGANGTYTFDSLAPGAYVVALTYGAVNGTEYLLPMMVTVDSVFSINWSQVPLMAKSSTININEGTTVENINAGMRLPMGVTPTAGTIYAKFSDLSKAKAGDVVLIDERDWVYVKDQLGPTGKKCVMLFRKKYSQTGAFGSSTTYEDSNLQKDMTYEYNYAKSYYPILYQATVVPDLAGPPHTSTGETAVSTPTAVLAHNTNLAKDIFFAPSYRDIFDLNGGKETPLNQLLIDHFTHSFYLRTALNTTYIYGVRCNAGVAGYIDKGIIPSATTTNFLVAVWVEVGATCEVTVHYIDDSSSNHHIGTPDHKVYPVVLGDDFSLLSSMIPDIPGYQFDNQWKTGASGNLVSGSPPYNLTEVTRDTDIYLLYKPTYTVTYKVNNNSGNPDYIQPTGVLSGATGSVNAVALATTAFVTQPNTVFLGWNTDPNGLGTAYAEGAAIPISGNVILHAQWGPNTTALTIEKQVSGIYADKTKEFTFRAYFMENDVPMRTGDLLPFVKSPPDGPSPPPKLMVIGGGAVEFTLKHNQSITLSDIPLSCEVRIEEVNLSLYTPKFQDSANNYITELCENNSTPSRQMTENRKFILINERNSIPITDTTIGDFNVFLPLSVFALISTAVVVTLKITIRRRQRHRF